MRLRRSRPIVRFATYFLSATLSTGFAWDDQPPVSAEHLGWTLGKHTKTHRFRITLVNRHDEPVWFLFPSSASDPLAKDGIFHNHLKLSKQPFGGLRHDGSGGSVVEVHYYGSKRDGFSAFHLPGKGRIELNGLLILAETDFTFEDLVVVEAHELTVNGKTPLDQWLPYVTTSGNNVVAARTGSFTNLDWDKEKRDSRDDYPKERVELVKAGKSHEWMIRFRPRGEILR